MLKQRKIHLLVIIALTLMLVVSACKPKVTAPQVDEADIERRVRGTQEAQAAQFATETYFARQTEESIPTATPTEAPTNTPEFVPPTATATLALGLGPTATSVQEATQPSGDAPGTQCLQMEFVKDGGVLPSHQLKPGEVFSKSWTIKNIGTCTWTTDYYLTHVDGEKFGSNYVGKVSVATAPGETLEIILSNLEAPGKAGSYRSAWMLAHPDGARFGYGANRGSTLNIQIEVKEE